ncbi:axoneme-associated protein mst101(2)-like [Penaeus vannamei]|uniref:axoneme-associated protein mst101(2)-like n=1 Tax=Penaeus vannamei TaxID=6689 RepID=UPI00387F39D9
MGFVSRRIMGFSGLILAGGLLMTWWFPCVSSFKFETGQCPGMPVVKDFNMDKFLGLWHVIQMTNTATRCYTMDFKAGKRGSDFSIDIKKEVWGLVAAGIYNHVTFTALGYNAGSNGAEVVIAYPTNAFGDVAMQVVDVSYDSWALLWACKRSMFGHMEAGIILSRSTGIGSGTLEKLRNTLAANGGELDSMATVQHGQCTGGGGSGFIVEFDPKQDQSNVNFDSIMSLDGGGGGGGGGGDGGGGGGGGGGSLNPCIEEGEYYYYYHEDCPDDVNNPMYMTLDEFENGGTDDGGDGGGGGGGDGDGGGGGGIGEDDPCFFVNSDYYWEYSEVCPQDVDYALSVDEYYDLYGDQLENEDSYDYYGDYYDYADGEGNEVYDYYDDYGDYEDYYESDGNSSDSDYYDDYYYDDYGYGDYDYDPARFEGRRCILIIDDEPVVYDECPEDYLYYAYLPEEYYQLQDFVGSPCYTFEDGEYMYYEECPEGTEGAIPASFMDFDDATARMGKRPLTGKAKRKEERREKRKERRKKMRAMKRKKKNGGKKGARKNGKNGKRNGTKGNKKGKGTKGKGKNRRKNKKSRSEIDDLEKIKKPKGEDLLRLIRNNKKVQKLLEEAGVSWRDLTPDIRLSKLRKMVGNKKLWKEIRKELVPKRVSSGWQRRMDKPQGLELWLMLTTNKKLIKLLLKAEVELTGKPFDLRFDDLRKMIKNKKIWKKIKSILLKLKKKNDKEKEKRKGKKNGKRKGRNGKKKGKNKRTSVKEILMKSKEMTDLLKKEEGISVEGLPDDVKLPDLKTMIKKKEIFRTIKNYVLETRKNESNKDKGRTGKSEKNKRMSVKEILMKSKEVTNLLKREEAISVEGLPDDTKLRDLKAMIKKKEIFKIVREYVLETRKLETKKNRKRKKKKQGTSVKEILMKSKEMTDLLKKEEGISVEALPNDTKLSNLKTMIKKKEVFKTIKNYILETRKLETKNRKRKKKTQKKKSKKNKRSSVKEILMKSKKMTDLLKKEEGISVEGLPDDVKLPDLKTMIKKKEVFRTIKNYVVETRTKESKAKKKKRRKAKKQSKNSKKKQETVKELLMKSEEMRNILKEEGISVDGLLDNVKLFDLKEMMKNKENFKKVKEFVLRERNKASKDRNSNENKKKRKNKKKKKDETENQKKDKSFVKAKNGDRKDKNEKSNDKKDKKSKDGNKNGKKTVPEKNDVKDKKKKEEKKDDNKNKNKDKDKDKDDKDKNKDKNDKNKDKNGDKDDKKNKDKDKEKNKNKNKREVMAYVSKEKRN